MDPNNFLLREKKYAKTKIAVMNEFITRLQTQRFHDISIKDVCDQVEVSEATFYNYFPQKVDLIIYFKQLFAIKTIWLVQKKGHQLGAVDQIHLLFSIIAEEMPGSNMFYEFISICVGEHFRHEALEISIAERYYAFSECPGIEDIPAMTFEIYLLQIIVQAVKEKSINTKLKAEEILIGLMAILVGIPMTIEEEDFECLGKHYKKQLAVYLKGVNNK
ncbi:MAG: TetR/AcrR family transcriptional regulator [Candidatus Omnitrophica bacterium]|nr:TetR/AcrR family transcriptional regulator [Candidatus Omnitrophota bacterium]